MPAVTISYDPLFEQFEQFFANIFAKYFWHDFFLLLMKWPFNQSSESFLIKTSLLLDFSSYVPTLTLKEPVLVLWKYFQIEDFIKQFWSRFVYKNAWNGKVIKWGNSIFWKSWIRSRISKMCEDFWLDFLLCIRHWLIVDFYSIQMTFLVVLFSNYM